MLETVGETFEQLQGLGYAVSYNGEQKGVQLYTAHLKNRLTFDFFISEENGQAVFGFSNHSIEQIQPIHLERLNVFRKVNIFKFAKEIARLGVDIEGLASKTSTLYYASLNPTMSVQFKRDKYDKFSYLQTIFYGAEYKNSFVLCNFDEFVAELIHQFRFA